MGGPGRQALSERAAGYDELKGRIHQRVIELLDLTTVGSMDRESLSQELSRLIEENIRGESVVLNFQERIQLGKDILNEVLGLGPLESLLADPSVSDILVNSHKQVFVERSGKLELTDVRFRDEGHLRQIIDRIVSRVGRRVDESSPMVDARLADGSRVNAIIPPLAIDGSSMSIRKFTRDKLQIENLVEKKSLTPEMGEILKGAVKLRLNILISGGTGTGKTTILNILSGFIPGDERIVTIEDAAELQLRQEHVVRLETRPANIEGAGAIVQRDLVKNALRMRPDRIIIGEVRGGEALDMLQAMNTGHDGSLATIHANTPRDALTRVETMVAMAGLNLPAKALRHYCTSALNLIVQLTRLQDGSRRVTSIQEITGMEGEIVTLQEIFTFEQTGLHPNGKVKGRFRSTGVRPKFVDRLQTRGITIPADLFDPTRVYEC